METFSCSLKISWIRNRLYFLQRTLNSHALWGILVTWWFGRELQCDVLLSCDDVFENILYGRLVEDQYMKEERRSILLFHHALFSHSCVEGDIMCHHGSSSFCCLLLVFFYHSEEAKMPYFEMLRETISRAYFSFA